jgi:alkylation response protein AidB-like acyl-CoA dehydrogenase
MPFELTDEQKDLKKYARDFLRKEIAPLVNEHERRGSFSREVAQHLLRKLKPLGYVDGIVPAEYGGAGLGFLTYGVMFEELASVWAGLCGTVMIQALSTHIIAIDGTDTIRHRLLPSLMSADKFSCAAITEPDAGSNSADLKTTAVLDGDSFIVNGTKTWISLAPISDAVIVVAATDKSLGPQGVSRIVVERDVSPYESRELHKLGWRAFPTGELYFDHCRVPRDNLLGQRGSGYKAMLQVFDKARSFMAIMSVGIAQAAIDASIKYAKERTQFGRPIGSFQLIQAMIVDMIAEVEAARLLSYRALNLIDKGVRCSMESSLAKAYATEMAVSVSSKGIQIHGGMGLSDEFPVERYFRDARMLTIPDGTTEIQKLIVGREVLGISAIS